MKNSNRINRSSESRGFLGVAERFTRRSPLTKRAGKSILAWRANGRRLLFLASLVCLTFIHTNANAQPSGCDCLHIDTSSTILCDTCWIVSIIPMGGSWDTTWACDTCYSFTLTNNCKYGINSIQIFDSNGTGGLKHLHHGCAVIQNVSFDTTFEAVDNPDGSITFEDTDGCFEPGSMLIVSVCNPLHRGDTIAMQWWSCQFPIWEAGASPVCPAIPPTGETVTIP